MSLLDRLFRKGSRTNSSASGAGVLDPNPAFLKSEFGLTRYQGTLWQVERVTDEFAEEFSSPEATVRFLRQAQASGATFEKLCIVSGPPMILATNSKPPTGFLTSLSGVPALTELSRAFIKTGAQVVLPKDLGLVIVQLFRPQASSGAQAVLD